MSTFETGQPLYDTLTVHFIVQDCILLAAWGTPPPVGMEVGDPGAPYPGGIGVNLPFDTMDVYACGEYEFPVDIHLDYGPPYVMPPVYSLYFEVDYDPLLEVFEVGNEGLITESLGSVLTYNNEEPGKIKVIIALNSPILDIGVSEWWQMFYVGFRA